MQLPNEFSNHLPFMTLAQLMRLPHTDENGKPLSILTTKQSSITHKILIRMLSFLDENETVRSSCIKIFEFLLYAILR